MHSLLMTALLIVAQSPVDGATAELPAKLELSDLFFAEVGAHKGCPRSLAAPELAGEVTLLAVVSSGSVGCAAAAPLLATVAASYRDRGLAVLGLAFEAHDDFPLDAQAVEAFAQQHELAFPFFVCGRADPEVASQALGGVRVCAFPTFVLVGRDRRAQQVLAWGAAGSRARCEAELRRGIETLLAEPADDGAELWSRLRACEWNVTPSRRMFPGDRVVFTEDAASRSMRFLASQDAQPVTIRGAVVSGVGTWRFDAEAGVLLHPMKFGARLFPSGGSATPLLERRGFTGEEGVLRALSDPAAVVRREALFALGTLRRRGGGASEAVPLLADEDLGVRIAAAWAIGQAKDLDGREALVPLMQHPYSALRCAVLGALTKVVLSTHSDWTLLRPYIEGESDRLGKWAVISESLD